MFVVVDEFRYCLEWMFVGQVVRSIVKRLDVVVFRNSLIRNSVYTLVHVCSVYTCTLIHVCPVYTCTLVHVCPVFVKSLYILIFSVAVFVKF